MDQMLPSPAKPRVALLMQQNTVLLQENYMRSQNEQALYAAWKKAVEVNNNLTTLVKTLQTHVQQLHEKLDALTEENRQLTQQVPASTDYYTDEDVLAKELTGKNMQVSQQVPASTEYHTDEDELAKETEWIVHHKKNAKKRKVEASWSTSKQSTSAQRQQRPDQAAVKNPKPSPIIIHEVRDYDVVYNYLNTKLEQKYMITLLNSGDLKLNVDTEEHYRTASKMLNEAQFPRSMYENKQTRPIRVTVKKLHSSCTPEQIVQELRRKGYQILDAGNILKRKTFASVHADI
jgi:hypothetical protein